MKKNVYNLDVNSKRKNLTKNQRNDLTKQITYTYFF